MAIQDQKEEIIKEAIDVASKALKVAFDAADLESQIRSTVDFPDGTRYFIEFKEVTTK